MTLLSEHVCSVWRNYEYSEYNLCQAYLIELSHVKHNDAGGIFRDILYMRENHETFLRINTHTHLHGKPFNNVSDHMNDGFIDMVHINKPTHDGFFETSVCSMQTKQMIQLHHSLRWKKKRKRSFTTLLEKNDFP